MVKADIDFRQSDQTLQATRGMSSPFLRNSNSADRRVAMGPKAAVSSNATLNLAGAMLGGGIRLLERTESEIVVADPFTGKVKNRVRAPYPNFSAALTTAGGLLFTGLGDGTFIAYDDTSLEPRSKITVGAGINAPAGGRQYVTVMTGLSRVSKGRITLTPELREMRDQTMLFVFGL
jgi:alcohol dehydrogenase (cytochrome c)